MASLPWGCQGPEMEYDVGSGQLHAHLRADAHAQAGSSRSKGRARCKVVVKPRALCTSRSPMSLATRTEENHTSLAAKKKMPTLGEKLTTPSNGGWLFTNCKGAPGTSAQPLVPSTTPSLPAPEPSRPSQGSVAAKGGGGRSGRNEGESGRGMPSPVRPSWQVPVRQCLQMGAWGKFCRRTSDDWAPKGTTPRPVPPYPGYLSWPGAVPTS